ncbi:MAG: DUF1822 family protein [Xenococcaceae cyanobacterium MO_207.B15]|nr:DUF1822 family protein [Xenococcaceae cyanobacterium MO_207.B15]
MNSFFDNSDNLLLDFETASSSSAISFEESQIQQAAAISSHIIAPENQWLTYLQALAWLGFESWLQARDSKLSLNSVNCSLTQPSYANFIPGVFNLEVNQFKVCLLTPGVMLDEVLTIPRAILDLPEYIAHFYVLVAVDEEREEATVTSFIPYDELKQRQQSVNLQPDSDWNYELPMAWLNPEPDKLLLYLRCLEPSAIVLPTVTGRLTNIANLQTELESLIPLLESEATSLQEILTWEQAIPILTSSALLDWLYHLKTTAAAKDSNLSPLRESLSATLNQLTKRAINVGAWLQNELDEISQSLAWSLLPTPALATSAFRDLKAIDRESPTEELATIITQLRDSGIDIPPEASSAYQDFTLGETGLRLFALAWELTALVEVPEWKLLIVLGAQPGQQLPQGLKLILQEQQTILDEKLVETVEDSYLYTLVIGTLEEEFILKFILPTGETLALPPFILLK